jgi:AraC-like DNA-binding protein
VHILAAMEFTDPESFEEYLAPVAGEMCVRPITGSSFKASLDLRRLQKVGLFTVKADSLFAQKKPQQEFYGFSIPLGVPFTVSESGRDQTFGRANAHMLSPGLPFNLKCKTKCHALVCIVFVDQILEYRERVLQETTPIEPVIRPRVSLMSAPGSGLMHAVARVWSALGEKDSLANAIALQELEDDLLVSFLSLAEDQFATRKQAASPSRQTLSDMEDYICANLNTVITRDDLATRAGVSIRSLSRAFEKEYGLGPMALIRQRRLDACYIQLRGSERGIVTVAEVAMAYGFGHMGKFAIAYKSTFGESPSVTLLK